MAHDVDPRVILAAERTLLAWIRTGVAMMGFGFVVARFGWFMREMAAIGGQAPATAQPAFSQAAGLTLVVLGIAVNVASGAWYVRYVARYRRGESVTDDRLPLSVLLAGAVAALGVALAWYLLHVSEPK